MSKFKKEIVSCVSMHGYVYDEHTFFINKDMCAQLLQEELTEESKHELFQAYYLHEFKNNITLEQKTKYGDKNCQIADISDSAIYLPQIEEKLKYQITHDDISYNLNYINTVLNLNEKEIEQGLALIENIITKLEIKPPRKKYPSRFNR